MPTPKHGKGWLQNEVLETLEKIEAGNVELPPGREITPHLIAKIIAVIRGEEKPPSTGAVTAVLTRWTKYGFITVNEKPFSFKAFTPQGEKYGLEGCYDRYKAALAKEKAQEAPANKQVVPQAAKAKVEEQPKKVAKIKIA